MSLGHAAATLQTTIQQTDKQIAHWMSKEGVAYLLSLWRAASAAAASARCSED